MKWAPGSYSDWATARLTTGFHDQRFELLGIVSPNLQQQGYTSIYKSKLIKSGDKLYVQDMVGGHYSTTDLKTWETHTSSKTNGKTPNYLQFFGIAKNGDIYMIDQNQRMVKKSGQTYEIFSSPKGFYPDDYSPMVVTQNTGCFFKTGEFGIGRFDNGNWHFYGNETFSANRFITLVMDRDEQVWTVTTNGNVWQFTGNHWTHHSFIPYSYSLSSLAFDNENNAYAHGDFGVAKYNTSNNTWEVIGELASQPVRKVIFDKNNYMWAVGFRFNDESSMQQSLIRYKDGKANIYADGLNVLRENFDIEIFQDKLLLLTGGGELHTFNERQIQRFDPKSGYCIGEEVTVTITSNSTFSKDKSAIVALRNTVSGSVTNVPVQVENGIIHFNLPESLEKGSYTLKTIFASPDLESNESNAFQVYPPATVQVSIEESGRFKTLLKVPEAADQEYKWQLNGEEIPGAVNATLVASASGNYQALVSNKGGCISKSAIIPVSLEEPNEVTLLQNTPNPAGASTDISFYLPAGGEVNLELFNLRGQHILQLQKGTLTPGWHFAKLNATYLPNGVYIYRLKAGNVVKTLKLTK